jgi:hypothetical protein
LKREKIYKLYYIYINRRLIDKDVKKFYKMNEREQVLMEDLIFELENLIFDPLNFEAMQKAQQLKTA